MFGGTNKRKVNTLTNYFQPTKKVKSIEEIKQLPRKEPTGLVRSGNASTTSAASGVQTATASKSWMSQSSSAFDDCDDLDDIFNDAEEEEFYKHLPQPAKLATKSTSVLVETKAKIENTEITSSAPQSFRKRVLPWEDSSAGSKEDPLVISGVEFSKHTSTREKLKRPQTTRRIDKPGPPTDRVVLSDEQIGVRELVLRGHSLFFTGAAGTGKSVLLRELIKSLHIKHHYSRVAVTASTGLAALNIQGETLHRFAGIGLGAETVPVLVKRIKAKQETLQRWKQCSVLVIDEISMVDGVLLDKLDSIARNLRASQEAFGGIQVVCTGDFFQLPPVDDGMKKKKTQFAFESKVWKRMMQKTVVLTKVFRQQGDNKLINMLNSMRMGTLTPQMCSELSALARTVHYDDGIQPTELYPTRREVEDANKKRLESLRGLLHLYPCQDIYHEKTLRDSGMNKEMGLKLLDSTLCSKSLLLRHDCQVMLIRNMPDEGLVNGSLGLVVAFLTAKEYDRALIDSRNNVGSFEEVAREICATRAEIPNSARSKETLSMIGVRTHEVSSYRKPSVPSWKNDGDNIDVSDERVLPVVRFASSGDPVRVEPVSFQIFNRDQKVICERHQVPLILSWAMSVHKSQGQTLERVKVNLYRTFEVGQAYVAVSRATSADRLQVINFNPSKVMASPKVIDFYNSLTKMDLAALKPTTFMERVKQSKSRPWSSGSSNYNEYDSDIEFIG